MRIRYTFREKYLRGCRAHDLRKSGMTLKQVGKIMGLSPERIRQLEWQYLSHLENRYRPITRPLSPYLRSERTSNHAEVSRPTQRLHAPKPEKEGWERIGERHNWWKE